MFLFKIIVTLSGVYWIFISMLNEGPILIAPEDKKAISKYLNDINRYAKELFKHKSEINGNELANLLNIKSNELKSNQFPFSIDYRFSGENIAEFGNDPPSITISIAAFTNWKDYWTKDTELRYCSNINFKGIASVFLHEFVHYIQFVKRQENSGFYDLPNNWNVKPKYYKRGWEQQAHAIQYLEQLKQELKYKKPEDTLSHLRKLGVIHSSELNKLKQTDYKSWKAIMKQAIMTAMADIEEGEPLPWQTKPT